VLSEDRFDFISDADKSFMASFDESMAEFGHTFGGDIGKGYSWGRYMVTYTKTGSKKIIARIYIRDDGIAVRLYFSNIDKHRAYIESAPEIIKSVFTNNHGNCACNPRDENCRHRKTYTIDGRKIEKCDGAVFEFWDPTAEKLPDYVGLLSEFYSKKK
jgi:hypothetical protein